MINRDTYLTKIINRMNNGMIKVITGIRRCGKSYLLFEIFYKYLLDQNIKKDHIIKFSFDNDEDIDKLDLYFPNEETKRKEFGINMYYVNSKKFRAYINDLIKDEDNYYILLDEIQNLDNFVSTLNGFLKHQNLDVYVTGSNAKFLSSDVITEFRGRGDRVHLSPLSFLEFFQAAGLDFSSAWKEYMTFGGMPFLINCKSDEQRINYLTSLFSETYIKDIVNRNKIQNAAILEDILNILSSDIGSFTNPNKLANTFSSIKKENVSPNTIKQYLDYCEDSYLISKSSRYDIKGKKYIATPFKYYFTDIGLRNARLNFRQQKENHIMENIIYNELINLDYSVDVGVVEIVIKNENDNYVRKQLEVDFVCNKGYERYYIQVALNVDTFEKRKQEENSLLRIKDNFKKIIIVKDDIKKWKDENGILFIGVKEFLLNPRSIES